MIVFTTRRYMPLMLSMRMRQMNVLYPPASGGVTDKLLVPALYAVITFYEKATVERLYPPASGGGIH